MSQVREANTSALHISVNKDKNRMHCVQELSLSFCTYFCFANEKGEKS